MEDPLVGQEVDGYRILEVLGQGGMGVVYKAKSLSLDRVEALKVITPSLVQDAQFLRRFRREAQALARIHHPNIVTVYTFRHAEIGYYLTMEYVEGRTLADLLVEGCGMDWRKALPIIKQLLTAFDFAHERGIIHRDIKPRNIMLTPDQVVKVMDFGLAKFYLQSDVTRTQGVSGTLCYMSPEQIKGHENLDQRSDIFSLGLTLYELLSGRLPFDKNDSQFNIQRSIVEGDFPAPHRFNDGVPARLSSVVAKAVHKDPAQRYQYASEMLDTIEAFEASMSGGEEAGSADSTRVEQALGTARRGGTVGRWARWAVGAALAVGMVWAAWALHPTLYERVMGEGVGPLATQQGEEAAVGSEGRMEASPGASGPQEDAMQPPLADVPKQNPADEQDAEHTASAESTPELVGRDQASSEPSVGSAERPAREGEASAEAETGSGETDGADGQSEAEPAVDLDEETLKPEKPLREEEQEASPPQEQEPREEGASGASTSGETGRLDEGSPTQPEAEAGEADRTEAEVTPVDQVRGEVGTLQDRLRQAIMDREWTGVPSPLADYYSDLLDDFYSRFTITNVESTAGEVQADDATVTLPVTVYISYRQKGREGVKAFPIPATWVWRNGEEGMALRRVYEP